MNTYITIPARYLLGRKLRTTLTTLAVVFGVMVIFGVNIMTPSLVAALNAGVVSADGQADITVSSAGGETFAATVLDRVRATKGVAAASPALQRQIVLPGPGAPQITFAGVDPTTAQQVRRYAVTAGRFLTAADGRAAVVSQELAQVLGLAVGSTFRLPTPAGLVDLPVVGVVSLPGVDEVLVPLATAQTLYALPGRLSAVDVAVGAGTDRDSLKAALQKTLGGAYDVGTAVLASDAIASIQTGLVIFNFIGVLTLFMGGFLIFNTFRAVVVERRHDIGMLRAVGATRGTIVRLILAESALQGVVGTAVGLLLGYLLALGMSSGIQGLLGAYLRVRIATLVVTPDNVALAIGLGILITIAAGLLPALTASRVPVLVALRETPSAEPSRRARVSLYLGAGLVLLGVAGLASGNTGLGALGGCLFLVGLVLLAPAALGPIARLVEPAMRWLFAREGLIAGGNLQRNPGRAAVTVSALMIGLAVVVGWASIVTSLQEFTTRYVQKSLGASMLLLPPNLGLWTGDVGAGPEFEQKLAQVPGVGAWTGVRFALGQVDGQSTQVMGIDAASYPQVAALDFLQGDNHTYDLLTQGRNAIVNNIFASQQRVQVGQMLDVNTPEGVRAYKVVGVGTDYLSFKINTIFISQQNMAADFHKSEDVMVLANVADGADPAQVRASVTSLLQSYPQLTLYWGDDWRTEQLGFLAQAFTAIYGVLALLLIPSLLGLINTLAINVLERTREIGVLRAIGATRQQVRRLVVAEALMLGAAGAALGVLGGLALGWMFTGLLDSVFGSVKFYFPFAGVAFVIVLAVVVAVLASLLPARQAARVQIVRALQYE